MPGAERGGQGPSVPEVLAPRSAAVLSSYRRSGSLSYASSNARRACTRAPSSVSSGPRAPQTLFEDGHTRGVDSHDRHGRSDHAEYGAGEEHAVVQSARLRESGLEHRDRLLIPVACLERFAQAQPEPDAERQWGACRVARRQCPAEQVHGVGGRMVTHELVRGLIGQVGGVDECDLPRARGDWRDEVSAGGEVERGDRLVGIDPRHRRDEDRIEFAVEDGGCLERALNARAECVNPGNDKLSDVGRYARAGPGEAGVEERLEEERIAAPAGLQVLQLTGAQPDALLTAGDERGGLAHREPFKRDAPHPHLARDRGQRARQRRHAADIPEPSGDQRERGHGQAPMSEMAQEGKRLRIGPVEIIQYEEQRPSSRRTLEGVGERGPQPDAGIRVIEARTNHRGRGRGTELAFKRIEDRPIRCTPSSSATPARTVAPAA